MSQRYRSPEPGVVEQTAILRDCELPEVRATATDVAAADVEDTAERAKAEVAFVPYPWLVVLTQECDLQFDRLAREGAPAPGAKEPVKKHNLLRSILLCPGFPQDHVLAGTYVAEARRWGSDEKKILLRNGEDRYHMLPAEEPFLAEPLILDFKLTVAAAPDYVYNWVQQYPDHVVAVLNTPFRHRLVQRFVNYFARIAEPEEQ
ncbi:MAG: hypothetical protein HYY03_02470 [Chloroflexi bacterium]|nr:hypothetical protein [Chloroflexota bacterium]